MPHSPRANETRRALYREGRLMGLSPREAGHLYSTRGLDRARSRTVEAPHVLMGDARSRQSAFRDYLELGSTNPAAASYRREPREVSLERSREIYRTTNKARFETKVELTVEDRQGNRDKRTVTVTAYRTDAERRQGLKDDLGYADEPPTRGQIRDTLARYEERGLKNPVRDSDRYTIVSAEIVEILVYPSVTF